MNLAGVQTLVLRVTDGGDGESNDHADWADAKIEMNAARRRRLRCRLRNVQSENQKFCRDFQVGDDGRLYQRPIGVDDSSAKLHARR